MKIVYVLVSDVSDYYLEQTYVSLLSLRRYNPFIEVVLVVDEYTFGNMVDERSCLLPFVNEYFVQKVDTNLSKKVRSRILKTRLRDIIDGAFIYIDCDTIVLGELPPISMDCDIAAVYSCHYKVLSQSPSYYSVLCEMDACGEIPESEEYFNGGVIYAKDSVRAHIFFSKWGELYKSYYLNHNIDSDQQSLYVTNIRMGEIVKELSGIWNYQVGYGLEYITKAIIFHYLFSTCQGRRLPVHLFQTKEFMEKVRRNIGNKDCFIPLIEKARFSFLQEARITATHDELSIIAEHLVGFAKNRFIYLYGQNTRNKMANYLFKKANIRICGIIKTGFSPIEDFTKIGIVILGPQKANEESISKLALMGFIHFFPIDTEV